MQSRWFHPPKLHSPALGKERKVGWLELFYDLIYVATIIQLGSALANQVSLVGFLAFAGLFVPLWFSWTGFTFYENRFVIDDFFHRALVFLQMFGIAAMAIEVPRVFAGHTAGFALAYASVRLVLVALYARTYFQLDKAREMTGIYALGFAGGSLLWLGSAFLSAPWVFLMWAVAMGVDLAVPLNRRSRALIGRYPPDALHMSERFGLLTLIVLGESFVKVLTELADRGATTSSALMGALLIAVVCSLWWIYFDDVAGSRIRPRRLAPLVWVYSHLPLTLAIAAVGVGIKKAVALDPFAPAASKYRWLLCGTLALAFSAVALIDSVTERRQAELSDRARVNVRFVSALLMVLIAPTGAVMPAWAFASIVAVVCVGQVLFDLMTAPVFAEGHDHHAQGAISRALGADTAGVGIALDSGDADSDAKPRRFQDVREAIRKGAPSELRRDLYFYFMEGSWSRLFAALAVLYIGVNGVFAALYLLEPGGVANVREGSFPDAFFFSVQTMATIGYGVMNPQTTYSHVLVTTEAAVGLLGVALATGVMFAKASRPRASVLFSRVAVVTRLNGRPVLMFRVGNARGNDVVEATMRIAVLKDELSGEGHRFRRFHDLSLERSTTPIFAITWMLIHPLEGSPLVDGDISRLGDGIVSVIASMTGFDGTYAQTTHARHVYRPEHILFGRRFLDVVSTLDDGRLLIDYDQFHDTESEPT
jgi:low temperature requirement protein LtrA